MTAQRRLAQQQGWDTPDAVWAAVQELPVAGGGLTLFEKCIGLTAYSCTKVDKRVCTLSGTFVYAAPPFLLCSPTRRAEYENNNYYDEATEVSPWRFFRCIPAAAECLFVARALRAWGARTGGRVYDDVGNSDLAAVRERVVRARRARVAARRGDGGGHGKDGVDGGGDGDRGE